MAKKKKKMTKAQAAAARRDDKPVRKTVAPTSGHDGPKSRDNMMFQILIPLISIAVIVIFSIVFSIGPGVILGS